MTSSVTAPRDSVPSQPSIVTHRWFPKVIGLWFAALFGLCSLALAPGMLEAVVTTLGIDRIVPAAAPPLGQTARLLLAMGMAGVGEIVGLVIGARLAASRRPQAVRQRGIRNAGLDDSNADVVPQVRGRDRHADAPPRKPLSAIDDLSGIDNALRRRALASEADLEPRPFFEVAPLPGGEWPQAAPAGYEAEPAVVRDDPPTARPVAAEALDLAMYDAPMEEQVMAESAPFAPPFSAPSEPATAPLVAPEPAHSPVAAPFAAPLLAAPTVEVASASLEALGVVQLSERLALALQARRERRANHLATPARVAPVAVSSIANGVAAVAETLAPAPEPDVAAPPVVTFAPPAEYIPPAAAMPRLPGLHAPFADASDDDIEEPHDIPALARSLAMPAIAAQIPEEPADEPEQIPPELVRGMEILARRAPRPTPEAQCPASLEADSWPQDAALDTVGGIGPEQAPVPAPAEEVAASVQECSEGDDPDEVADETVEGGYSSLLAMGSSFARPEPVRIEEPQSDEIEPVVIFPGQGARTTGNFSGPFATPFGQPVTAPATDFAAPSASQATAASGTTPPADAEETDRALRAALASLQRISGAR